MNAGAASVGGVATERATVAEPAAGLSPTDLADLLSSFNAAAARLQATHETLAAEVARLKGELIEAREQAARSKRLAALGEMAAGISHEVRNPLGSIRLYARMLEQDLADRPEQRRVAQKIALAVAGLDGVVSDVLSFARELRVRSEAVDAEALLRGACEAARADTPAWRNVDVRIAARGQCVNCDAALMQQALVNLIRNGVEAMAEGESAGGPGGAARPCVLRLEARATRAADAAGGPARAMHALVVADTGPGLSAETIERMFNPFFTTRATGTGLGLAIVHRIVDAHGGRVAVSNAQGGGAVIEVLLPRE